jgi:SAM-dependent methyltransferase
MMLLSTILLWVLVVVLFAVFFLLSMWVWASFKAPVPFIPVPESILPNIYKALDVKEGSVVYDLGCGDARVLIYGARRVPEASYIGIENNPFSVLFARVAVWWQMRTGKKNVQIIKKDFFTEDLSKATHIFTYLYPNIMDDLLQKFEKELAPGTRLVSIAFRFTQKPAIAEIDLERRSYQRAHKIYIYEF